MNTAVEERPTLPELHYGTIPQGAIPESSHLGAVGEEPVAIAAFRQQLIATREREAAILQAAAAARQEQIVVEALQNQHATEEAHNLKTAITAPVGAAKAYNDVVAPATNYVAKKVTSGNVEQLLPTNPNFQGVDNALIRGVTTETEAGLLSKAATKEAELAAKEAAAVAEATKNVVVDGTAVANAADAAKYMQGSEVLEVVEKSKDVASAAAKNATQHVTVDVATGAIEQGEKAVIRKSAAVALQETGETALAVGGKVIHKTGEKALYKAADGVVDAGAGAAMEAAAQATGNAAVEGAAHTVSKANIAFEVVNGAVKMGTGYVDGERQKAALVAMYLSDLEDAKAQGVINYQGEKPDFQALRDLAKVKGWEGVEAEVARIDAGLGDAAIKAGTGAGFSAAGTAIGATVMGAIITGTGVAAPVGIAVGAVGVAGLVGSVCVSMAGGHVVDSWLAKETGVTMSAEITHKLQSGKPVDTNDVFKVYLADDENLQKALNGENGHRSILTEDEKVNGGFAAIKSSERQLQILEKLDAQEGTKMKEACGSLAEGLMAGVAQAKDLSTFNGKALQEGGAEVAEILVKAKAVEDEKRVKAPISGTPDVANENIPPSQDSGLVEDENIIKGKFTAMHRSRKGSAAGQSWVASTGNNPKNPVEQAWTTQMASQRELAAQQVLQH